MSPDLVSRVTDAVMDDVRAWGKRPLEDIYPIVFGGEREERCEVLPGVLPGLRDRREPGGNPSSALRQGIAGQRDLFADRPPLRICS